MKQLKILDSTNCEEIKAYKEHLQNIYLIFCDTYGEENIDIQFENKDYILQQIEKLNKLLKEEDYLQSNSYKNIISNINESSVHLYIKYDVLNIKNTVSGEHEIRDLFVSIEIIDRKIIEIKLGRSSYTLAEIMCGYRHSHIEKYSFSFFTRICLGYSNIKNTISKINNNPNNYYLWKLFSLELDIQVSHEFIEGGPYINIKEITASSTIVELDKSKFMINSHTNDILKFINYKKLEGNFFELFKNIKINANNHEITLGIRDIHLLKYVSKALLLSIEDQYLNNETAMKNILLKFFNPIIIKDNKLYLKANQTNITELSYFNEGTLLLIFKDKEYKLNIIDKVHDDNNYLYLLKPDVFFYFKKIIYSIILDYLSLSY